MQIRARGVTYHYSRLISPLLFLFETLAITGIGFELRIDWMPPYRVKQHWLFAFFLVVFGIGWRASKLLAISLCNTNVLNPLEISGKY